MDAEDILGYVLEYRLDVKKMEGVVEYGIK